MLPSLFLHVQNVTEVITDIGQAKHGYTELGVVMLPGKFLWKPLLQKAVTGRAGPLEMKPDLPPIPARLHHPGLYLHVPFCKNLCPYCPYNRVQYSEDLFAQYERAVIEEIDLVAPDLQGNHFISLYIGGGTPTVHLEGLLRILTHLRKTFSLDCDICIELHPGSMDGHTLELLQKAGVTLLSIGVESTSDEILERIGRNHDGKTAIDAIQRAKRFGFRSINVDLMFALPGQTQADWDRDVKAVVDLGIDQLSTYPLFSFPYSDLGTQTGIRKVTRPSHHRVRAMLDFTEGYCNSQGLKRCAVWSWLHPGKGKFSSITRHHYIGFGPSAASMTGTHFFVNTFNTEAYAASLPRRRPVALSMPVDRNLEMAYWLYWRVYELKMMETDFQDLFNDNITLEAQFGKILKPFIGLGMIKKIDGGYQVTRSGAYWIHRLQNEYSLNYINRLWGTCRREAWPECVCL